MDPYEDFRLKLFCFRRLKVFWLVQKLRRLKMAIAVSYSDFKLVGKAFQALHGRMKRTKEIHRMVSRIRSNKHHSLQSFVELTPLEPSIAKFIFILQYDRIKTMRKYFNKLLFHSKVSNKINEF